MCHNVKVRETKLFQLLFVCFDYCFRFGWCRCCGSWFIVRFVGGKVRRPQLKTNNKWLRNNFSFLFLHLRSTPWLAFGWDSRSPSKQTYKWKRPVFSIHPTIAIITTTSYSMQNDAVHVEGGCSATGRCATIRETCSQCSSSCTTNTFKSMETVVGMRLARQFKLKPVTSNRENQLFVLRLLRCNSFSRSPALV